MFFCTCLFLINRENTSFSTTIYCVILGDNFYFVSLQIIIVSINKPNNMNISEIANKIDVSDSEIFFDYSKKWIEFVISKKQSADISESDWQTFFASKNPAAGIDRGALQNKMKDRNNTTRDSNEQKSFKDNWNHTIRPKIEDAIRTKDISEKIKKIKELDLLILDTIKKGGGRNVPVATNRMLSIFFPGLFVRIPQLEKLNEFIVILKKRINNGNTLTKEDNWIDNSYQVKLFLDRELNDDKLTASAWNFYNHLKEFPPNDSNITNEDTKATTSMDKIKYDDFLKLLKGNYNLILTGAPGTGKTYLAKKIAEAMEANEDSIKMVQFHPSYDYTDFVEGLRPIKEGDTLGFQRKDGVFKAFCKDALDSINNSSFENLYTSLANDISKGAITTYSTLSGIVYPIKVIDGVIKYGCKNNGKDYKSENVDNIKLIYQHYLIHPEDIDYSFEGLRNLISKLTNGQINTLDPSEYSWTIKELLSRRKDTYKNFVFIIDEINRGEISKIFGELFYSIDSGYRGIKGRIETQYQNLVPEDDVFSNGFYIPKNVYIIGTMNDIDRSVESMDFAMRRRFAWKEITAKSRQPMLDEDEAWGSEGKPSEEVIAEMKARMDNLNAAIIDQYGDEELTNKDKIGLTKAYQIGAAYFLKYSLYSGSNKPFDELWTNHLKGLLYEYLRGKPNIDEKIKRLYQAYNDTTIH